MNPAVRGIGAGHRAACGWLIDRFGLRWQIVPDTARGTKGSTTHGKRWTTPYSCGTTSLKGS